ncbi:MAG: hypothetical protein KDJ54_09350 [Candidatus Competibacteraceae bacterium]|nr:hypothetical protein [Candidatus Competibacteraceae bacterium]
MSNWYEWVFSGIGVVLVTAAFTFIRTKAKYFTGIRFLDRNEIDRELGTLQQRFEKAKTSVFISGNDLKFVAESSSSLIDSLLNRKIKVKLLATNPGTTAAEMLEKIDPRFNSSGQFQASMEEVQKRLEKWKKDYPSFFEYRLLPFLPALGFFITDPNSPNGIVKIEIYTAKEFGPINSRPHIVLHKSSRQWREYFIKQSENYWDLADESQP